MIYKECEFQTIVEARWSVYFETLGIEYEYENGLFWLPQVKMWAIAKNSKFTEKENNEAKLLLSESGFPVLQLVGKPDYKTYIAWTINPYENNEVFECDYLVSTWHGYVFNEGRFYSNTECWGMDEGDMREYVEEQFGDSMTEGIEIANNTKFIFTT